MIQFRKGYYADVRIEDRFRTIINYRDGQLVEYKTRNENRAFIRVYDGKMWYYASVTDTARINETLSELYAAATQNDAILADPVVKHFEVNKARVMRFSENSVRDIPSEEKRALLESYLHILSSDSCMTMPVGIYLDRNSRFHFESSLGADIEYD